MKYNPIRITHKCQPEKTYYQNIINKLLEKQYNGTRYVEKKTVVASWHIQKVSEVHSYHHPTSNNGEFSAGMTLISNSFPSRRTGHPNPPSSTLPKGTNSNNLHLSKCFSTPVTLVPLAEKAKVRRGENGIWFDNHICIFSICIREHQQIKYSMHAGKKINSGSVGKHFLSCP